MLERHLRDVARSVLSFRIVVIGVHLYVFRPIVMRRRLPFRWSDVSAVMGDGSCVLFAPSLF